MHVQVIRSKESINNMLNTLYETSKQVDEENQFVIRPICSYSRRSGIRETNQNLVFSRFPLSSKFVETCELPIVEYNWENFKSWDSESETNNLHFKGFPRTMSPEDVEKHISGVLSFLLKPSQYTIDTPLAWKSSNTVKGFGSLTFTDDVSDQTRKLCKLLLHNMNIAEIGDSNACIISFHWSQLNPRARRVGRMIPSDYVYSNVMEISSVEHHEE